MVRLLIFQRVIQSFRDKDTRAVYEGRRVRRFDNFRVQAERRLNLLDNATALRDLAGLPSNRLEALSGDRKGKYSIRINRRWRICFDWRTDGPRDVEIVDYH
jgi:proteic killer suppression protein